MKAHVDANAAKKHRPGVCHRCGWAGAVSRPSRRQRQQLRIGRSFGRLCDDCLKDLVRHPSSAVAPQAGQGRKRETVRQRHVA